MHPQTTARSSFNIFRLLSSPRPVRFGNSDTGWPSIWLARLGVALVSLVISVTALAQADNDLFANRTPLTGTNLSFQAVTLDATVEPGEPNHGGPDSQSTASVWWTWTAPFDGLLVLRRENGDQVPGALAIYRGESLGQLTRVGGAQGEFTEPLLVTGGTRYAITVSEVANPDQFLVNFQTVELRCYPKVGNDAFAGRQPLVGEAVTFEMQRTGATREPGEPALGDNAGPRTRWYTWQAPGSGEASVTLVPDPSSTFGSGAYEGVVAAYEGTQLSQLQRVAGETVEGDNVIGPTLLLFHAVAGHTYQLVVADGSFDPNLWDRPGRRFQLSLSRARLTSPSDGLTLPAPAGVKLDLSGAPTGPVPLTYTLLDQDKFLDRRTEWAGAWQIEPPAAGRHEFRLWVTDGAGRSYFTPAVVVTFGLPNDNFAGRTVVSGKAPVLNVDVRHATYEAGEPPYTVYSQPASVWWTWTAPADGVLVAPGYLPWDAFTGNALFSLQPVPILRRGWPNPLDEDRMPVVRGWTYQLRVVDTGSGSQRFEYAFEFHDPPANDHATTATPLSGAQVKVPFNSVDAQIDPSEPSLPPGYENYGASLWYAWTAPERGRIVIASDYSLLSVYDASPAPVGARLAGPSQPVEMRVEPGHRYLIQLLSVLPGVIGDLSLIFSPALSNDEFSRTRALSGTSGEFLDNNRFATTEPGEPLNGQLAGHTLWYSFIPPADGILELSAAAENDPAEPPLEGATSQPALTVFQGAALSSLQAVTVADPLFQVQRVPVSRGLKYWIRLDNSAASRSEQLRVRYAFHPQITNDAFAHRIALGNAPDISFQASNWGATREPNEPPPGTTRRGSSVWWTWTAPATGTARFLSTNATRPPRLTAYVGNDLSSLTGVSASVNDGTNTLATFPTVAGQAYQLVFDYPYFSGEQPFYGGAGLSLQFTTLNLTAPVAGSVLLADSPLTFQISQPNASLDGNVRQVEYVLLAPNSITPLRSLGVASNAPFSLRPEALPPGSCLVEAIARLANGSTRTTPPLAFKVVPANDSFAAAQIIASRAIRLTGSFTGASSNPGEPVVNPGGDRARLWYRWTAPGSAHVEVSFQFGLGARAYRGMDLANLIPVTDAVSFPNSLPLSFEAEANVTYWIALAMPAGGSFAGDNFFLEFTAQTVSLAEPIAGSSWPMGATLPLRAVTGELPSEIAGIDFLAGDAVVGTTTQPPYSTVWKGGGPGTVGFQARTHFANGDVTLSSPITVRFKPPNDDFADAGVVSGATAVLRGTTHGAGYDSLVPVLPDYLTVWHRWVAPITGRLQVEGDSSSGGVFLSVLQGDVPAQVAPGSAPFDLRSQILDVSQGRTYWFMLSSPGESSAGDYEYHLNLQPAQANDSFARRLALSGSTPEMMADTLGASAEPGEPAHGSLRAASSLWWTWTPPADGVVYLQFLGVIQTYPLLVDVYTGETLGTLQRVGGYDSTLPVNPPAFAVHGGQAYQIAFDDQHGENHDLRLQFHFYPSPRNDTFANRELLPGDFADVHTTSVGATLEPGEPDHHPGRPNTGSLWWRWRAPISATVRVLTEDNNVGIAVYRGGVLDRLQQVTNGVYWVEFMAEAGVEYAVATDGIEGPSNNVRLQLVQVHAQPGGNDLFAQRQRFTGDHFRFLADNRGARREFHEPLHGGRYGGHSVWYAWRAPTDGLVTIIEQHEFENPLVGVYTGTAVDTLHTMAGVDGQGTHSAILTFAAKAGEDYAIAVDGQQGCGFDFSLRLVAGAPPAGLEMTLVSTNYAVIRISGLAGRSAALETSTDLINWTIARPVSAGEEEESFGLPTDESPGLPLFLRVNIP